MKFCKNLVLLTLVTLCSFGVQANSSTTVQTDIDVTAAGMVSASWIPSTSLTANLDKGTELGRLNISFSNGNAVKINQSTPSMIPGAFQWRPQGGAGGTTSTSLFAKAYFNSNELNNEEDGSVLVTGLDGKNNIDVVFKTYSDLKRTAGTYVQSLVVDLYTI